MKKPTIRTATIRDLSVLLQFEQGIIEAERPYDPTLDNDPISYYDLKELINSDTAEVVVAEVDGSVVSSGYAKIKKARHYLNHQYYCYLGFMFTLPSYRGHGINKAIVKKLTTWANDNGLEEIRLTVYEDNVSAIRAYEKVGFKKHLIEMRLLPEK